MSGTASQELPNNECRNENSYLAEYNLLPIGTPLAGTANMHEGTIWTLEVEVRELLRQIEMLVNAFKSLHL